MKKNQGFITGIFIMMTMMVIMEAAFAQTTDYPNPVTNPLSPIMLKGDWVPENTGEIDFYNLPRVAYEHIVISNVSNKGITNYIVDKAHGGVNQHNYLTFFDGNLWIMWSDGPGVEDRVGQRVSFSKSVDGTNW